MQAIQHILVVIDPTVERDFVVDRAKLVAKAAQARVTLLINNANSLNQQNYQYEGIDPDFFVKQHKLFTAHYQQILKELEAEFAKENIKVSTRFSEKNHLAEAIIHQAVEAGADLVIKSTHHHNLVRRSLITNTDWRLIRKCPTRLLLVKPKDWKPTGSIVTAVDPLHAKAAQSTLDHNLLQTTTGLSELLNLQPHVFHSYFPFASTLFASGVGDIDEMERVRQQHADKLSSLLANYNIDPANVCLSRGELVPKLIEHLEANDANMLVIGALSRNFLERAIVGVTAEKILEDCPCDVMVLKPDLK